jgi:hypothetical protein
MSGAKETGDPAPVLTSEGELDDYDRFLATCNLKNRGSDPPPAGDWMAAVYTEAMEFSRFHNGLVWQVSSIFVPFSIAGFAVDFTNENNVAQPMKLLFVAGGSIGVMLFWTVLAEWHRWLWVHSFYCAACIEHGWGYRQHAPAKPKLGSLAPPSLFGLRVRSFRGWDLGRLTRWFIAGLIILAWLLRLAFADELRSAAS